MSLIGPVFLFGAVISVAPVALLAWTIFRADRSIYHENRKRTGRALNPFRGVVAHGRDGARDSHVHAGLVFNKRLKSYQPQHALSDEAIRAVLVSRR
jgi:hypothetical protein